MKCRGLKLNGKRDELLKRVRDCLKSGNHHTLYPSTDNGKWLPRKFLKKVHRNKQIVPKTLFLLFLRLAGAFFPSQNIPSLLNYGHVQGSERDCKGRSRYTFKNSSEKPFDENITSFKTLLRAPPTISLKKITSLKSNSLNGSRLYSKPIKCVRKCCLL